MGKGFLDIKMIARSTECKANTVQCVLFVYLTTVYDTTTHTIRQMMMWTDVLNPLCYHIRL